MTQNRLYKDQLAMTERHLQSLIEDSNGALELLTSLAQAFRAVDEQTSSFKAQCDDLLSEQTRLQKLADEVGTDLYYYSYLDTVTRRLNGPGASRLVEDDEFGEIWANLDSCIAFMTKNVSLITSAFLVRALLTGHRLHIAMPSRIWRAIGLS